MDTTHRGQNPQSYKVLRALACLSKMLQGDAVLIFRMKLQPRPPLGAAVPSCCTISKAASSSLLSSTLVAIWFGWAVSCSCEANTGSPPCALGSEIRCDETIRNIKRDVEESCLWIIQEDLEEEIRARLLQVPQAFISAGPSPSFPANTTRGSLPGLPLLVPPLDFAVRKPAWTAPNSSPWCEVVPAGLAGIAGGVLSGPGSSMMSGRCRPKGGHHVRLVELTGGAQVGTKCFQGEMGWPRKTPLSTLSSLLLLPLPPHTEQGSPLQKLHLHSQTLPLVQLACALWQPSLKTWTLAKQVWKCLQDSFSCLQSFVSVFLFGRELLF